MRIVFQRKLTSTQLQFAYRVAEAEFMAFGDIENHDNYYTHQEGRVHVQDERGCYIVYDAAREDLRYDQFEDLLLAVLRNHHVSNIIDSFLNEGNSRGTCY